ncbi:PIN domain-containing protein [Crossiella sp. CA198]|uniref:PIN domain-containing protein n=1 Tax=Crossiella sp. CA198 TaxID=3455607 RepID=UPI003F8CF3C0
MPFIVLDTDVTSNLYKRNLPADLEDKLKQYEPTITFITAAEMRQWAVVRKWGQARTGALAHWLRMLPVFDSTLRISTTWGDISGRARIVGRPTPHNDTWVAAVCLTHGLPLLTQNVKDFQHFADHEGLKIVTA